MQSIMLQKLAENPIIAYSIKLPKPEEIQLSQYEQTAFPALFGQLTGISIERIVPKYQLGRIMSFDITPRNTKDPLIIFSTIGNLENYYKVWSDVVFNGIGIFRKQKINRYDNAMQEFYQTAEESGLSKHEIVFATIEMLKFKNDVLLNYNWE